MRANGQAWGLQYAMAHRIEHPNCRRAFAALPSDYEGPLDRGERPGGGGGGSGSGRPPGGGGGDAEEVRKHLEDRLKPSGRLIGRSASRRNKRVRFVSGTDYEASSFEEFFLDLAQYGDIEPNPRLEGILVRLIDVGELRYRYFSSSGHPTIDVIVPGIGITEIKYEG